MLVSGGGGEVAVFHINFFLPSKVGNFLFGQFSKLVIFIVSERKRASVDFIYETRFPPKDLEKFLLRSMIPNAHA